MLVLLSSLNPGGAETQTVRLVNALDTGKFAVSLRYFDKREALLGAIDPSQVESVKCLNRKGRFDLSLLKRIRDLTGQDRYDVVLCISPYPALYGYLVRLLYRNGFKLVTAIHQTLQRPGWWEGTKTRIHKTLLNRCDLNLFVCKNQLDYWVNTYNLDAGKCRYIYNGIDVEHFASYPVTEETAGLTERYHIGADDIVLGNVAGFRSEKKQEDLVAAAKILREQQYPVKVLLVGDGPRRPEIERYIRVCNLEQHVILTGLQKDVRPYLHLSDCFVISSHQETFSLAALEAMAAAKPVVMTDVGGAEEMVENGVNGFLYTPGNVDELAEKIKTVIDGDLYAAMGYNSKRIVSERFTSQRMVREYEAVLSDL
jgi:glycosyltransferase involved in cell wall biosynthesis